MLIANLDIRRLRWAFVYAQLVCALLRHEIMRTKQLQTVTCFSETYKKNPNVPVNYNVLILMNIPNLAVKHSLNAKDSTGSKDSCGHDEGIQLELGASLINAQI
jgi:hypothetical protein